MKGVAILSALVMCFGMLGCASSPMIEGSNQYQPQVSVGGPAKLDKDGVLDVNGVAFKPDQEITLIFVGEDGVDSDIGFALEPVPQVGDDGSWKTKWNYGLLVAKKMVKEGSYQLSVYDQDFNLLCNTPVNFE